MQRLELQTNIQCSHCVHKWNTKSEAKNVTCPSCQLKTLNPQCTLVDMKPLYLKYVRDMKPEPKQKSKVAPLDYATRRAQLEQEFIERYQHVWIADGGSVRPIGMKKITLKGLEKYIEAAKEVNQHAKGRTGNTANRI